MDEHGGNIEKASREYRLIKDTLIDFSANINPLGIPQRIQKTIAKAIHTTERYPDPEYSELREGLSSFYGVRPYNILADNGSVSLIYLIPRALGLKRPLIPLPAFSEYEKSVYLAGTKPVFLKPRKDFSLDIDNLLKQLKTRDSLYIGNPNNPTGALTAKEDLLRIFKAAKAKNIVVIIDEVFIEFTKNHARNTLLKQSLQSKNLIVLRSMTKYFAMAGLRLGTAIAHQGIITRLKKFQPPWAVNALAITAATAFINDKKYLTRSSLFMAKERKYLYASLALFSDLKVWIPSANFIFCKLQNKKISAEALREALVKNGILIRDCANFRGLNKYFFRVAIRTRQENLKLLKGLREALH